MLDAMYLTVVMHNTVLRLPRVFYRLHWCWRHLERMYLPAASQEAERRSRFSMQSPYKQIEGNSVRGHPMIQGREATAVRSILHF